jgi:PilZ domain-containing protein
MPKSPSGTFRSVRSTDARFRALATGDVPTGPHIAVRTTKLGAGGAFLIMEDPLPVGTRLQLELLLPKPARPIVTICEVRSVSDAEAEGGKDPRGVGVKFEPLSEDDLRVLGDFLSTETGRFSAA